MNVAGMSMETIGLMVHAQQGLGVLHRLTGVIAEHQGDITSVEIQENSERDARALVLQSRSGRKIARDNHSLGWTQFAQQRCRTFKRLALSELSAVQRAGG